jgi:2-methylisocitrate lyase-like PEP mutase family enzyme
MSEVGGPVNVARMPEGQPVAELAALGVARVSWGPFLHWDTMAHFKQRLATLEA